MIKQLPQQYPPLNWSSQEESVLKKYVPSIPESDTLQISDSVKKALSIHLHQYQASLQQYQQQSKEENEGEVNKPQTLQPSFSLNSPTLTKLVIDKIVSPLSLPRDEVEVQLHLLHMKSLAQEQEKAIQRAMIEGDKNKLQKKGIEFSLIGRQEPPKYCSSYYAQQLSLQQQYAQQIFNQGVFESATNKSDSYSSSCTKLIGFNQKQQNHLQVTDLNLLYQRSQNQQVPAPQLQQYLTPLQKNTTVNINQDLSKMSDYSTVNGAQHNQYAENSKQNKENSQQIGKENFRGVVGKISKESKNKKKSHSVLLKQQGQIPFTKQQSAPLNDSQMRHMNNQNDSNFSNNLKQKRNNQNQNLILNGSYQEAQAQQFFSNGFYGNHLYNNHHRFNSSNNVNLRDPEAAINSAIGNSFKTNSNNFGGNSSYYYQMQQAQTGQNEQVQRGQRQECFQQNGYHCFAKEEAQEYEADHHVQIDAPINEMNGNIQTTNSNTITYEDYFRSLQEQDGMITRHITSIPNAQNQQLDLCRMSQDHSGTTFQNSLQHNAGICIESVEVEDMINNYLS